MQLSLPHDLATLVQYTAARSGSDPRQWVCAILRGHLASLADAGTPMPEAVDDASLVLTVLAQSDLINGQDDHLAHCDVFDLVVQRLAWPDDEQSDIRLTTALGKVFVRQIQAWAPSLHGPGRKVAAYSVRALLRAMTHPETPGHRLHLVGPAD
ncbi:hypothetical protein [Amycolatopsis saalfeldensis]|uniref:Uncharacterized protein n=1 Tax=Amycolatopsis saalfeldensis TaxID=394193 RepID=A0A1H8YNJ3_9PSEU|nr:hypothetical protein [Amycolatopsis saalfeldensis]SEP53726.1 hypothetical protein SAMN04489732_13028 [Amycolatopsis saalfeldensis]